MAPNTWFSRDLPVLDAIVVYLDEHGGSSYPQLYDIAAMTGLHDEQVVRAAAALEDDYIQLHKTMGPARGWAVVSVNSAARIATGQWPNPETLSARILAGIEAAAEAESDDVRRGKLRSAAEVLGTAARDVGTDVLTAVILRATGMG